MDCQTTPHASEPHVKNGLLSSTDDDARRRNVADDDTDVYIADCKKSRKILLKYRHRRPFLMATVVFGAILAVIFLSFYLGRLTRVSCTSCDNSTSKNDTFYIADRRSAASSAEIVNRLPSATAFGTPIVRLGKQVFPVHYDLLLNLRNLQHRRIDGSVSILLRCDNDTKRFSFHMGKEITFDVVHVSEYENGRKGADVNVDRWIRHAQMPLLTIQTKRALKEGGFYVLKIDFVTTVCGQRSGFICASGADDVESLEKMSLATNFEPNFARTAFPCFDEPHIKATFNLSIIRTREMTVLTNTAPFKCYDLTLYRKIRQGKGDLLEQFEQTPPMSTYLFALFVGPMVSQEANTDRGVKVAVWTRFDDKKKAAFALTYTVHMLNSIENYFMIQYPMNKLDLVALDRYPVGGMENWGLIFFHNQMLLYDDDTETTSTVDEDGKRLAAKFKVANIIAHEVLHQWFGNLVTMHWWSEMWLNEGFAMFYLNYFVKHDFQHLVEFNTFWKLSQTWSYHAQLPDTADRPALVREFRNEESIHDAFDEWNLYAKGSTMVKLLSDLLGEQSLRGGLINYLRSNAYGAVSLYHLWDHLGQQFREGNRQIGIGKVMDSWLKNPGFPELRVTRDYKFNKVLAEQRIADYETILVYWNKTTFRNYTWSIPVAYVVQENLVTNALEGIPFWLHNESDTFIDKQLTANQWLLINPDFQFPYRINYDIQNWRMLIRQLLKNYETIPVNSRLQLILDSSFFLRETEDLRTFVELMSYLKHETELLPAIVGMQELASLFQLYKSSSVYPFLIVYFREVVVQLTKLRDESRTDPNREAVWRMDQNFDLTLKLLQCVTNSPKCRVEREELQGFLSMPFGTDSSMLVAVCHYLFRKAVAADKTELLRWLEQTSGRRGDIVILCGCVRDRKLNRRLINILIERNNAKLLASAISGAYSLSYNSIVHQELWLQLGALGKQNVVDIFKDDQVLQRTMLRHVATVYELSLARKAFGVLTFDLQYAEAALEWRQRSAPKLEQWLIEELNLS